MQIGFEAQLEGAASRQQPDRGHPRDHLLRFVEPGDVGSVIEPGAIPPFLCGIRRATAGTDDGCATTRFRELKSSTCFAPSIISTVGLLARYAVPGADVAYGATRSLTHLHLSHNQISALPEGSPSPASVLPICYAFAPHLLRICYVVSRTDVSAVLPPGVFNRTFLLETLEVDHNRYLSASARAPQCLALTQHMMMPGSPSLPRLLSTMSTGT